MCRILFYVTMFIQGILAEIFPGQAWQLRRPTEGFAGTSYIASGAGRELFIKLDADVELVHRVSDLGVAPPFVAGGTYQGRTYVIQEYLPGTHPDRNWFPQHLPDLAALFSLYHNDAVLKTLLSKGGLPSYRQHIDSLLAHLDVWLAGLVQSPQKATLARLLAKLKEQALDLEATGLVPTHADPNNNNFLLVGARIYLLDWDNAFLSDPLKDIGPMLWWYVPQEQWPGFLSLCSIKADEQATRKVYWWAARQSGMVALWIAREGYPDFAEPFVTDFAAALNQRPNPRS